MEIKRFYFHFSHIFLQVLNCTDPCLQLGDQASTTHWFAAVDLLTFCMFTYSLSANQSARTILVIATLPQHSMDECDSMSRLKHSQHSLNKYEKFKIIMLLITHCSCAIKPKTDISRIKEM